MAALIPLPPQSALRHTRAVATRAGNVVRIRRDRLILLMSILTSEQVATELAATPGWLVSDGQLTRTVTRRDFRDALLFVNAVGFLAERADHHPDIAIAWNAVTLTLSTHSAGGLTEKDFALARQISDLG